MSAEGGLRRTKRRPDRVGARPAFLQLDEQDMRRRLPRVLTAVNLRVKPSNLTRLEADVATLAALANETTVERGKRVHHAIRVFVWAGRLSRLVAVFKNADALVLEDDLVLVGIGACRICQRTLLFPKEMIGCRS